jgi:hypothetical protein
MYAFYIEDIVLDRICDQFGKEHLKYCCVANEYEPNQPVPRLHIQLLLKHAKNTTTKQLMGNILRMIRFSFSPFFQSLTSYYYTTFCLFFDKIACGCEFKVTRRDRAWNEYLKKG